MVDVDAFAYLGGLFAMISFVPQIIKGIRTRSMYDLSWLMLLTTLASVGAYQVYAWSLWLPPVLFTNGVFIATLILTIGLKLHFDKSNGVY